MNAWQRVAVAGVVSLASLCACGGESESDATGGSGGGGAGGSGGASAGGGGSGGLPSGGSAPSGGGTGACGPAPGNWDCVDPCTGQFHAPYCDGTSWTCGPDKPCLDAGPPDAAWDASTCPSGQVPSIQGCLSCADVEKNLNAEIEAARKANASCSSAADCVLSGSSTACSGACGVAVSKAGESAFQASLKYWDAAYCSGYVPVCGYSTPKCALPTLACTAGLCEAKYN